jgi:hypothetical protein
MSIASLQANSKRLSPVLCPRQRLQFPLTQPFEPKRQGFALIINPSCCRANDKHWRRLTLPFFEQ